MSDDPLAFDNDSPAPKREKQPDEERGEGRKSSQMTTIIVTALCTALGMCCLSGVGFVALIAFIRLVGTRSNETFHSVATSLQSS